MIPSLLGNIPDLRRLRKLADENNLIFIEDSADTLGATFDNIPTGKFSDISTLVSMDHILSLPLVKEE